jgi:hypothetical protein
VSRRVGEYSKDEGDKQYRKGNDGNDEVKLKDLELEAEVHLSAYSIIVY